MGPSGEGGWELSFSLGAPGDFLDHSILGFYTRIPESPIPLN